MEDSLLDKDEDKDIADILSDGTDTQPNQKVKLACINILDSDLDWQIQLIII